MTEARFRARDGVELAYTQERGAGERLVLVVPGILTDRRCAELRLLARELMPLGDVATLDVRGHGDSGGAFSYGRLEPDDVAEWARALAPGYRELVLVGFSFGGLHALVAAARHPGLVARVASVAAPAHLALVDHVPSPRGLWRSLPWMARRRRRLARLGLPRGLRPCRCGWWSSSRPRRSCSCTASRTGWCRRATPGACSRRRASPRRWS